ATTSSSGGHGRSTGPHSASSSGVESIIPVSTRIVPPGASIAQAKTGQRSPSTVTSQSRSGRIALGGSIGPLVDGRRLGALDRLPRLAHGRARLAAVEHPVGGDEHDTGVDPPDQDV